MASQHISYFHSMDKDHDDEDLYTNEHLDKQRKEVEEDSQDLYTAWVGIDYGRIVYQNPSYLRDDAEEGCCKREKEMDVGAKNRAKNKCQAWEDQNVKESGRSKKEKISRTITEKVTRLDHVTLNIAVTGNSGAGKSTFVNSIRGLDADDDGAAPTGVTETTLTPAAYPHPTMPNVNIWDLPGIGTPNFQAKTYLSDVKFKNYDFFIIITSERFKENDINLAKAIKRKKKMFYFVRSKIDNDIAAESRRHDFSKDSVLSRIREDCKRNLKCVGKPPVFLISSFNLQEYDFTKLVDELQRDLPEKKRNALIQSLPVYSAEALAKKTKYLQKMIWLQALSSGLGAMVPIPFMTLAIDYGIATSFFDKAFRSFGLDKESLDRLATRINVDKQFLKNSQQSRFKDGITGDAMKSLLCTHPTRSLFTIKAALSAIIVAGALPSAAVSVGVMVHLLRKGLREMATDAEALLVAAGLDQV